MNAPITPDSIRASIQQLLEATTPARDAFHIHGRSYRGLFQSSKGLEGEPIPFESGLARDALRLFELAPEVTMIVPEPGKLRFTLDGQTGLYWPDYLLHLRDGQRALVEIKYADEAQSPANQARHGVIGSLVEQAGGMFVVLTEKHLRTRALKQNIPLLERHKHEKVSLCAWSWLQERLASASSLSFGLVAGYLGRPVTLAAIAQGLVTTDFRTKLITDASLLRRI